MLVTETTPVQGSRVRFPVKALRFFSEFFQREKYPGHRLLQGGFFPGISLQWNSGFSLALQAQTWANAKQWLRAKQKGVDKVDHSDAIGRERRPCRRGTGSLNKDLFRSGLHWKTDPIPCKGQRGWLNQLGAGLKYDLHRRCLPVR